MTSNTLIIDTADSILTLTLNRPDNANALNPELTEALIETVTSAQDVRLCILRGAGRHFCAGFDLSDLENLSDGDLLWRFLRIETLLQSIHHAGFPVAAFAQGQAVGAGADLFAACWYRVATAETLFKMPGWNFELALGTRRLTHLVGQDAARDLLIDTRAMNAEEGASCKLVSEIAGVDDWPEIIKRLAKRTQALSRRALRDMLALTSNDSREQDIAAIVRTAGRPGLKQRIMQYRERVQRSRKS